LLGRGEPRQQPLEVAGHREAAADLVGEHRLRGAGRPDDEHVLGGEERHEGAVDQLRTLEEDLLQLLPNGAQRVAGRGHGARIAGRPRREKLATGGASRHNDGRTMSVQRRDRSFVPGRRPRPRRSLLDELLPRLQAEETLAAEEQLVREMIETSLKLLRDGTRLGDIKLLNAALRELRYALKVFAPYARVRKVSVFGSARTPHEAPAARAAREFARRITDAGFMVITGAGGGIMHAAQEGAGRERSFGVNIRLPFEQEPNPAINRDPK